MHRPREEWAWPLGVKRPLMGHAYIQWMCNFSQVASEGALVSMQDAKFQPSKNKTTVTP
jgi:hypothetical protein